MTMKARHMSIDGDGAVIDHLMATGEIVPSQMPVVTLWSAEKRLAAAVLASALISLRDRRNDPLHRDEVAEDLAWLASDESASPYSFVPLCELFGLDAAWVRSVVERWAVIPRARRRAFSMHRHAA
jgi:hypothetical protein